MTCKCADTIPIVLRCDDKANLFIDSPIHSAMQLTHRDRDDIFIAVFNEINRQMTLSRVNYE